MPAGKSEITTMPGPWEVVWLQGDKLGSPTEVCVEGTDRRVAFLASDGSLGTARLIAAAPDLAQALADIVETFRARPDIWRLCGPHEEQQVYSACRALAKAQWKSARYAHD